MSHDDGVAILLARRGLGVTQAQLAAQCGISAQYLSDIERGRREGTLAIRAKLAFSLRIQLPCPTCRLVAANSPHMEALG